MKRVLIIIVMAIVVLWMLFAFVAATNPAVRDMEATQTQAAEDELFRRGK